MSATIPDLETVSAEEVLAYAVERFHPRLKMACSFQKEESVLVHMLTTIEPDARVFMIDTGVLFGETLDTWKRFEDRFGVSIEVIDARSPDQPWDMNRCCGEAKVEALERALEDIDAWVTGIRREQSPTRADAAKVEYDERRGHLEGQPARRLEREGPVALHLRARSALSPAARPGLRVDRLRAMHAPGCRSRGPLGRPRQDRMRDPRVKRTVT